MNKNETVNSILERRSIRAYKPEQISSEQLDTILECALWAPTARNEQELICIAVQDRKILEEIAEKSGRDSFYKAPTAIFVYGDRDYKFTYIDAGICVENMAVAAQSLGLGSVIVASPDSYMNGEDKELWKERFGVPENYKFQIGLAVGYADAETAKRPRKEGTIKIL